jgi:hypothetical protein
VLPAPRRRERKQPCGSSSPGTEGRFVKRGPRRPEVGSD